MLACASSTLTRLRDPLALPGFARGHHEGTDAHGSCGLEGQLSAVALEGQVCNPHCLANLPLDRGQTSLRRNGTSDETPSGHTSATAGFNATR